MKTVIVHPERCVGCMQCMTHCAVAHSQSQSLYTAVAETPRPAPRIHVGPGPGTLAFPNKCRHCDPAPCMQACMPRAMERDAVTGAVLVNPARCISCGMCSMACPFGVIRYRADWRVPGRSGVAVKCDNCAERQKQGEQPACVEACLVGALEYAEPNSALQEQTRAVARQASLGIRSAATTDELPAAVALWRALGEAAEAQSPD